MNVASVSFAALFGTALLAGVFLTTAGCSSDDAAAPSASTSTADAGVRHGGSVTLRYASGQLSMSAVFVAQSATAASTSCTSTTDGACKTTDCVLGAGYDASVSFDSSDSAGTLTFRGGALPDAASLPYATDHYGYQAIGVLAAPWKENDAITIAASGDTVPAFQTVLNAPALTATLTSPVLGASTPAAVDRSTDLALQWSGVTGGQMVWLLQVSSSTRLVDTICSFDGAKGTASVPATVLAKFPAVTATAIMLPTTVQDVTAGAYTIGLSIQGTATNGTGSVELR